MARVVLTIGGRFLRLVPDGSTGVRRVQADATTVDAATELVRVTLPHGRVALRAPDGCYLAHRPDDGQSFGLYAQSDLCPRAAFEEILWPDGRVSLRTCALTYVGTDHGHGDRVVANRTGTGAHERFSYVSVPPIPRQPEPPLTERRTTSTV